MYSRQDLADGFRRLGVSAGDVVMLHASVRAVGPVAGGPDQIHLALKDALTPDGTLVMYASCPAHYDEVGRGNVSFHGIRARLSEDARASQRDDESGRQLQFLHLRSPGNQSG